MNNTNKHNIIDNTVIKAGIYNYKAAVNNSKRS